MPHTKTLLPEPAAKHLPKPRPALELEELTEEDLQVIRERENEPMIPFEDVLKRHPHLVSRHSPQR